MKRLIAVLLIGSWRFSWSLLSGGLLVNTSSVFFGAAETYTFPLFDFSLLASRVFLSTPNEESLYLSFRFFLNPRHLPEIDSFFFFF